MFGKTWIPNENAERVEKIKIKIEMQTENDPNPYEWWMGERVWVWEWVWNAYMVCAMSKWNKMHIYFVQCIKKVDAFENIDTLIICHDW